VITNGSAAVATLQLSGAYTGDTFGVAPDGHSGSLITVSTGASDSPPAAAPRPVLPFVAAMAGMGAGAPAASSPLAHAWNDRASMLVAPRTQMA
jgi:hypothetical protein